MTGQTGWLQGRWRLRTKFLVGVNLLVLTLVLVSALLVENRQRNIITREVEKRALVIAQRLADSSLDFMLTYNYVAVEQLTRQIEKDPDIVYAILLDKEGKVAAHNLQDDLLGRMQRDVVSAQVARAFQPTLQRYVFPGAHPIPVYDASAPILVEQSDEKWGTARVGVSLAGMQAEIARTRWQVALFGLLAVAMGSLASAVLARRIIRPIQALARGVAAVGRGDFTQRLSVATRDELGDLAAAFNEMTRQLAKVRELEDRLRTTDRLVALGTLAAGIAHDIRNPLTTISIYTQLMAQHHDDPRIREKFERMVPRELERMQAVLDDMLELARPHKLTLELIDLNETLLQALEIFETQIASQKVTVKRDLRPNLPLALADRKRMHRCFMNVIANAIQAMPSGGELTLSTSIVHREQGGGPPPPSQRVWDGVGLPEEIVISIGDTGQGIREEQLPRIFDPFFTTRDAGIGLGMAITHKILEDHHARIAVTSRVDQGSTVTIHFPARIH